MVILIDTNVAFVCLQGMEKEAFRENGWKEKIISLFYAACHRHDGNFRVSVRGKRAGSGKRSWRERRTGEQLHRSRWSRWFG